MARRSPNSRRLANRQNSQIAMGMIPGRRRQGSVDWIVAGASVDSTGASETTTNILTSWNAGLPNPATAGLVASGDFVTTQAVLVQPTPMTSTPTVGRLRLDRIKGTIDVVPSTSASSPDIFSVFVAMYVAHLNNTTTKWEVRNPLTIADVARDDYLYLEKAEFHF